MLHLEYRSGRSAIGKWVPPGQGAGSGGEGTRELPRGRTRERQADANNTQQRKEKTVRLPPAFARRFGCERQLLILRAAANRSRPPQHRLAAPA